jgi:hypothetical protein
VRCIVDAQLSAEPWPAPSLVGQRVLIELGPLRGITGTVLVERNVAGWWFQSGWRRRRLQWRSTPIG